MAAGGSGRSQPAGPVLEAGCLPLSSPGGAPRAVSLPLGTATLGLEESLLWPLGGSLALALWMPLCRQGLGLWSRAPGEGVVRPPWGGVVRPPWRRGWGQTGWAATPPGGPPRALPRLFPVPRPLHLLDLLDLLGSGQSWGVRGCVPRGIPGPQPSEGLLQASER